MTRFSQPKGKRSVQGLNDGKGRLTWDDRSSKSSNGPEGESQRVDEEDSMSTREIVDECIDKFAACDRG